MEAEMNDKIDTARDTDDFILTGLTTLEQRKEEDAVHPEKDALSRLYSSLVTLGGVPIATHIDKVVFGSRMDRVDSCTIL